MIQGREAIRRCVDQVVARHALREEQRQLLLLAVEGGTRREIAARLKRSENTVKSQIRELLRRCGGRSLAELACTVLRRALLGPPPATTISKEIRGSANGAAAAEIRDAG